MAALHRVLVGHQHGQPIAKIQVGRDEGVMVGEGMLDRFDAGSAQAGEEPRGMADRRHGVHALAGKIPQRPAFVVVQRHHLVAAQLHRELRVRR